MRKTRY